MRAGHAIAFSVDSSRPLLLDESFQSEIEGLAGKLAGKKEGDFDFAGGEYEGGVDDAERLGEEGEVGAEERDVVVGVLCEQAVSVRKTESVRELDGAYIVDMGQR